MKVFSPFLNGNTTTSGSFNVPNHPGTGSIPNPLTGSLFHDDTDGILKVVNIPSGAIMRSASSITINSSSAFFIVHKRCTFKTLNEILFYICCMGIVSIKDNSAW